ncbi:MAG: hypothetical protein RBU45_17830 [Myxococcota bacterium]|jgi:hypothetical protein|nr:hypothetical protein [Myxococcota bacterium]
MQRPAQLPFLLLLALLLSFSSCSEDRRGGSSGNEGEGEGEGEGSGGGGEGAVCQRQSDCKSGYACVFPSLQQPLLDCRSLCSLMASCTEEMPLEMCQMMCEMGAFTGPCGDCLSNVTDCNGFESCAAICDSGEGEGEGEGFEGEGEGFEGEGEGFEGEGEGFEGEGEGFEGEGEGAEGEGEGAEGEGEGAEGEGEGAAPKGVCRWAGEGEGEGEGSEGEGEGSEGEGEGSEGEGEGSSCDKHDPEGDSCENTDPCKVACNCKEGVVTSGGCSNRRCISAADACSSACEEWNTGSFCFVGTGGSEGEGEGSEGEGEGEGSEGEGEGEGSGADTYEGCTENRDCASNFCVFQYGGDARGICTLDCESWSNCPSFSGCCDLSNGGFACVPDAWKEELELECK